MKFQHLMIKNITKKAYLIAFCLPILFLLANTCMGQRPKKDQLIEEITGITWIHAHEEDTENARAYRQRGYDFPPSRGREGFRMEQGGGFEYYAISPTDGHEVKKGQWKIEDGEIVVRFKNEKSNDSSMVMDPLSLTDGLLKFKKQF